MARPAPSTRCFATEPPAAKRRDLACVALLLVGCDAVPNLTGSKEKGPELCGVVPDLVLERALPVEGPKGLEPSGLTLSNGELFTVSDGDDRTIYALELREKTAVAHPRVGFVPPSDALDMEGVAIDSDGSFLVTSEAQGRVLRVASDGKTEWATPSLSSVGNRRGLLKAHNAGLEGIARLADGSLLLAAERDAPGLIHVPAGGTGESQALTVPDCSCLHSARRHADLADLSTTGTEVFALARNEQRVVKLEKVGEGWTATEAWSYAATENDPRFAYQDQRFPLAEGLVVTDERVYVILDNNETNAHKADPNDVRPMLFVFARPRAPQSRSSAP
jgi:hypothetical protein